MILRRSSGTHRENVLDAGGAEVHSYEQRLASSPRGRLYERLRYVEVEPDDENGSMIFKLA